MRTSIVLVDATLELVPGSHAGEILDSHAHVHLTDHLENAGQRDGQISFTDS